MRTEVLQVRLTPGYYKAVIDWAEQHGVESRSEAVRQMITACTGYEEVSPEIARLQGLLERPGMRDVARAILESES